MLAGCDVEIDAPQHLHIAVAAGESRRASSGSPWATLRLSRGELRAEIGLDDLRVADDLARRAIGDQLALVQHRDSRLNIQHHLHQMLDQRIVMPRAAIARMSASAGSISTVFRPGVDFVEHQQLRLHREALRELESLAARQVSADAGLSANPRAGRMSSARARLPGASAGGGVAGKQRPGHTFSIAVMLRERLHDLECARDARGARLRWEAAADSTGR